MASVGALKTAEFTAETAEAAIAVGLRTLGVSAGDVQVAVVPQEQRRLVAPRSNAVVRITYDEEYCRRRRDEAEIEKHLTLRYAPDGFTLRVDPLAKELQPLLVQVATAFLDKNHVPDIKRPRADELVEAQSGQPYVAFRPEVLELDGVRASFYCSLDKMRAYYIQYDRGCVQRQTLDETLAQKGIVNGLLDEALAAIAAGGQAVGLPIVIAQGRPPRHETAPAPEYLFNPSHICISFREDASVDFRNMTRLSFVKKGDVLIRKGERTPGEKGLTVTGEEVPFEVETDRPLPKGPNTYVSPDLKELRACIDGHIEVHEGQVCIEEAYLVNGDVDYHTGHVEFDGSIIVSGDVLPGFRVRAKGNVEIFGSVEDAVIEAGGDVVVQFGIVSKTQGRVTAKGDIKAWHLENVAATARRIYVNSSAVNCRLSADEIIEVKGMPGALVGGVATANEYVLANCFGSELGTRTEVVVGDPTELDQQIAELKGLIGVKARRRHDLIEERGKPPGTAASPADPNEVRAQADGIEKELPELRAKLHQMREARRRLAMAKCHVFTKLYDGCHVRLFTANRFFTETVEHCTLLFDKQEVRPFPFQECDLKDEAAPAGGAKPPTRSAAGK